MTKLSTVLDQVDNQTMLLPEFQRGYVWNRDQVRGLMRSVYREYPVGALLVWETDAAPHHIRGKAQLGGTGAPKHLLLDGQQRVTTLYGVIRGRAPGFFDGDAGTFTGLHFNVDTESFEFYAPARMRNDHRWIDVTELFRVGKGPLLKRLMAATDDADQVAIYLDRLGRLTDVLHRDFHVEQITGPDKTIDVVVDIFNRVNSGGTKLSKGDLALARICSEWDQARPWMRTHLDRWDAEGYSFTLDWILRNITAVATGRAPFSALEDVSATDFEHALHAAVRHIDHVLGLAVERLGLDHNRVLFGRYAFPVLARLLSRRPDGRFADGREADRALAWYVHGALRGRFTGPTETNLNKDLQVADAEGVDGLLTSLTKLHKGSLTVRPDDFEGSGRGARSYPLLYLVTRTDGARDLLTGETFTARTGSLHVQEIFPKWALTRAGYSRADVNAIANFAFVTHDTGQVLGKRLPEDHLAACSTEGLRAQSVPRDPALWSLDRYHEFLAARRAMLATAADTLLDELAAGKRPWPVEPLPPMPPPPEPGDDDARAAQIKALIDEFAELGYTTPATDCEIPDPDTGRTLAVAEAFWVDGLQAGQGNPVVLELDPDDADLARLAELGCDVFTSVDALRNHVQRRGEVASGARTDEGTGPATSTVDPAPTADTTDSADDSGVTGEIPAESPAAGDFDSTVVVLVDRCVAELRYNPRYFRVMITQHGALGATRRLLAAPAVSDGFVKLWENGRLDLTAEALVVEPRFRDLFTEEERRTAQRRLEDFGYSP